MVLNYIEPHYNVKVGRSLLSGVSQKADGVKTDDEFFGGVNGTAACLTIEINNREESFEFASDDRDHEGKPEHTGASE